MPGNIGYRPPSPVPTPDPLGFRLPNPVSGRPPIINPSYTPSSSGPFLGPAGFGAGQGPTQSTGQAADNPFNNSFFFQIPTQPAIGAPSDNSSQQAAPSQSNGSSSGYGQYLPLIVVGLIVAGGAYFLFGRK